MDDGYASIGRVEERYLEEEEAYEGNTPKYIRRRGPVQVRTNKGDDNNRKTRRKAREQQHKDDTKITKTLIRLTNNKKRKDETQPGKEQM